MAEALHMKNIVKVYPNGVMANKDVTLCVNQGEIHALSGENGAGKSTLMNILFGEEQATSGEIFVNGNQVNITSPQMAIDLGIGMVHQHFMLVPSLTVTENMIMGVEPRKGVFIDTKYARQQVEEIGKKYNLYIDPDKKISDLTVGQKQKVEILKALFRGAKILILDEPTAVLTPQETAELFEELKNLKNNGYTIIFISHKLNEVKEICDRITIIRRGVTMGVHNVADVTEEDISRLMVGRDGVLKIEKAPVNPGNPLLKVRDVRIVDETGAVHVDGVSFTLREGEILGVAGVEGNGQSQLINAITGMGHVTSGTIELTGKPITNASVSKIRELKLSHIPEDRMTSGVASNLSITENIIADKLHWKKFSKFGFLKRKEIRQFGDQMVKDYQILCKNQDVEIGSLSDKFEPNLFTHRRHVSSLMKRIEGDNLAKAFHSEPEILCATCHHRSPLSATPPKCGSCHSAKIDPRVPERPTLKAAYHLQCMGCHDGMDVARPLDTSCASCHKPRATENAN